MSVRFRLIVVVVAVGAIVFSVYRNRHDNTVKSPGLSISVLVAKQPIVRGTTGDAIRRSTLYTVIEIPRNQVHTGAIGDPGALAHKVALTSIDSGQQLTAAEFGPFVGLLGGPTQRAVVLRSPKERGGKITVGGHVDVWAGRGELYRDLYVLAVDEDAGTVTLRATQQQAQALAHRARYKLVLRRR